MRVLKNQNQGWGNGYPLLPFERFFCPLPGAAVYSPQPNGTTRLLNPPAGRFPVHTQAERFGYCH